MNHGKLARSFRQLLKLRLSRRDPVKERCERAIQLLESADVATIQGAISQIDEMLRVMPIVHALDMINVLKAKAPMALEYIRPTVEARERQAKALGKVLQTFDKQQVSLVRAALDV